MKRVLVLLLVLLPLSWFGAGCQSSTVPGSSGQKKEMTKEEKTKMDKGTYEMMKKMMPRK